MAITCKSNGENLRQLMALFTRCASVLCNFKRKWALQNQVAEGSSGEMPSMLYNRFHLFSGNRGDI